MIAVFVAIAVFIGLVVFFANRNEQNKKKIQQHIANGDIDPTALENVYVSTPDTDTRQTFRDLTNRE